MSNWAIGTAGSGGSFTDFDTLGFTVAAALGAGMPDLQIISTPYATQDGASFQRTRATGRVFILRGQLAGSSVSNLNTKRAALIAVLRRDNADPQGFVTIRYTGGPTTPLYLDCYYEQGVTVAENHGFFEDFAIRFWCADPFWYGAAASTGLTNQTLISNVWGARRSTAGAWASIGGNAAILAFLRDSAGATYAGGDFTSIGGSAITRLAKFNGSTWAAVGTAPDSTVRALAQAPDGSVYAGGAFLNIGGGAANRAAKWNGTTWAALGTGLNGDVYAIVTNSSTYIYMAGAFTTAGGATANRISAWTGSAWDAGGGTWAANGPNGTITAMVMGLDGKIYVGGSFTTCNAGALSTVNVARYDPVAGTWAALGTGLNGACNALAVGLDGTIYAGGAFTTAGGLAAPFVAAWTGTGWAALGSGLSAAVASLSVSPDTGVLWAAGAFTPSAAAPVQGYDYAQWSGGVWLPMDIYGTRSGSRIYALASGELWVSHTALDNIITTAQTTVTNAGSAAVAPTITITSVSGAPVQVIRNERTGAAIYLAAAGNASETVVIDCAARTITASGVNALSRLLPGSQLGRFLLLPGANVISVRGSGTITIGYTNQYWSYDG